MSQIYDHNYNRYSKPSLSRGKNRFLRISLCLCLGWYLPTLSALATESNTEAKAEETIDPALPKAQSIDLGEPVIENILTPALEDLQSTEISDVAPTTHPIDETTVKPLILLGSQVLPGTSTRLAWSPSQSFEGISTPTPVLVVHGATEGPVLCLTAAIHGDELNGIEIVRRVMHALKPQKLSGSVIGVPIVNLQGFHRSSRYLPDRRDLNRFFPGNPQGSSASRIAHSFFREIISHCDVLVDMHTGSFHRINMPQLRADLSQPEVAKLTQGFGATAVLHSLGAIGTLRRAATDNGIPAASLEAGGSMHLEEEAVNHGVKGIQTLINALGMHKKVSLWGAPEPVYYQSTWIRTDRGGILFSRVKLGESVDKGDLLGTVTDPITNIRSKIISSYKGRVLGMAINQVVQPGFAAFRIGIQKSEGQAPDPEQLPVSQEIDSQDLANSQSVDFTASADNENSE